ncbi:ArsR/SmtB family transcription factor [Deinococcus yavapaiensis]|uniref:ArsR family transcriptional regulator n=1 Tax=Deinococcus yavapaiensis KR-236 TaxID=694435 RepID=A0A318SLW7_9DEIO|nr:metalloregulator ArsR/SmtB family transcription factor [Deinococcus yavapaiensis]PYE53520.1 ArsR family transcriptional regulator [Deinococcus yavapaiensis KR-236]
MTDVSALPDLPEAPPADALRALADPTRLRILEFMLESRLRRLRDGNCFGGSISQHLGLSQPTVSHHMKTLVEVGLVRAEKHGTTVFYDLESEGFERVRRYLDTYVLALRVHDPEEQE